MFKDYRKYQSSKKGRLRTYTGISVCSLYERTHADDVIIVGILDLGGCEEL
jgi:hypothetical protein